MQDCPSSHPRRIWTRVSAGPITNPQLLRCFDLHENVHDSTSSVPDLLWDCDHVGHFAPDQHKKVQEHLADIKGQQSVLQTTALGQHSAEAGEGRGTRAKTTVALSSAWAPKDGFSSQYNLIFYACWCHRGTAIGAR